MYDAVELCPPAASILNNISKVGGTYARVEAPFTKSASAINNSWFGRHRDIRGIALRIFILHYLET